MLSGGLTEEIKEMSFHASAAATRRPNSDGPPPWISAVKSGRPVSPSCLLFSGRRLVLLTCRSVLYVYVALDYPKRGLVSSFKDRPHIVENPSVAVVHLPIDWTRSLPGFLPSAELMLETRS